MAQAPYGFDTEGRSTEVAAISLATGRDKCQGRGRHMNSRFSEAYRACALYFGPGTPARPCSYSASSLPCNGPSYKLIVGLDVALKGPFPLVGESELARESEMACFGVFHLLEIHIRK
jgi:hypothetical protein